jgi:L-phenylalanine/L-methionine N-acetyltransferase
MDEILIRAACPEDAADIAEIATQPQVVWGTLQLPAQTVAGWRKRLEGNDPSSSYVLAAVVAGKVVGLASLHWGTRPRTRHMASLGMFVHDAYQGRGIGTLLMEALIDAADRWLGLVRVELEVYPDNERAVRLYERFGFQVEGRKRLNTWRDGRYVDSLVMGRLRPDMAHE